MASGSPVSGRHREQEVPPETSRSWHPGLTPVTLFLVLMLFWVLTKVGLVLVLGLLALVLGTVLEGPVRRIEQRHVPRAAAIATVYVVLIGALVLLVFLIVPVVRDQSDAFRQQIPAQLQVLRGEWRGSSNPLLSGPGSDLLQTGIDFFNSPGTTVSQDTAQRAIPIVAGVGTVLVSTLSVFVITFYYLLEKRLIRRVVISYLSPSLQPRVSQLWDDVENKVGGWLRGQLLLCLIIGSIATISYGIIGLSFWPLLGLWAGVTEIIPIVGPWIGGVPAVVVALTNGWQTALIVAIVIVGMQTLENWFLVPRVMRGAVGLTPLTVFLAILSGTQLMGVPGAILAIPIAATVQVIVTDFLDQRRVRRGAETAPVSGWRWMLNRGLGREHETVVAPPPPDDVDIEGQQIESEPVFPGPVAVEEPSAPSPGEAMPASPWVRRHSGTRSPSGWRGMPRATGRPGPPPDPADGSGR